MPDRTSKRTPRDLNQIAASIVDKATKDSVQESDQEQDSGKNPAAVALGRLGGKKGGPARAKKLTPEQRSESARKAAQARWRQSG